MGIEINDVFLTTLPFADNRVVLVKAKGAIDNMVRKLTKEYETWGSKVNMDKPGYLRIGEE